MIKNPLKSHIRGECEYELIRAEDFIVTVHRLIIKGQPTIGRLTVTWGATKVYTLSPESVKFNLAGEEPQEIVLPYDGHHAQLRRVDNRIHFEIHSIEIDLYDNGYLYALLD